MAASRPSRPVPRLLGLAAAVLGWLLPAAVLSAATYYVSPNGNDARSGDLKNPFASLQRAQQAAGPGDTVLIRGGDYRLTADRIAATTELHANVIQLDKSGAPGRRINYWAYPGERPVFDFSRVKPADRRVVAFDVTGSWIHIRGLEVTGVQVTITGHTQSECFDNTGDHNIYERCSMHDGMGIGLFLRDGSDNLVLNCDAFRNWDSVSEGGRGGNVDGFGAHPKKKTDTGNVFRGCRAWFNSDDGYDCINAYAGITFENCWSFFNGYTPDFTSRADGNGFKAGGYGAAGGRHPDPVPRHVTRFCLAVGNKTNGFYANHHIGGGDWINNTAYRNGANYNLLCTLADNQTDVPGYGHFMRNNLGFAPRGKSVENLDEAKSDVAHNFFSLPVTVTAADFASAPTENPALLAQLSAPRQPDGSQPDIPLLHLVAGSDLINAGVATGAPSIGSAPDLGAFEYNPAAPRRSAGKP